MAKKYRFTTAQRFAVWQTHLGQCYWCGTPLGFPETTVDHVIPELYESRPEELKRIVTDYGLDPAFEINSFENWVPAHAHCNRDKGTTLFAPSPAMLALLVDVARVAPAARETHDKVLRDNKKGQLLGRLAAAVSGGVVTKEELLSVFDGLEFPAAPVPAPAPTHVVPPPAPRRPDLESLVTRLAPGWTVVGREFNLVHVTDGRRAGVTTAAENPDTSWMCPYCGSYGPWNGVICLSCMRISDPAD